MQKNTCYTWLLQGFDGDTSLGDVVRAAMFSKSFPDVKSPDQMAFEMRMESIINDEEIDLDDLSAAEFVTDSESDEDNENIYQILEDMDFLGDVPKKRKREDPVAKDGKNEMDEGSTSGHKRQQDDMDSVSQPLKKKSKEDAAPKDNEMKPDEKGTSIDTPHPEEDEEKAQGKKQSLKHALGEMTDEDKKAIGVLFLSIKQMHKAAKLNLSALT